MKEFVIVRTVGNRKAMANIAHSTNIAPRPK